MVDRADMWWPRSLVVGEADGDIKYDGSLQDPHHAIRREKLRDRRLRQHAEGIAHWGWSDVADVDALRGVLISAGLRTASPENSLELHALRALLHTARHRRTGRSS